MFSRLDEYIENYVRETGQELKSKSSTPEAEASKLRHELSNDSSGMVRILNAPSILNINGTINHSLLYVQTRPPSFVGDE